MTVSAELTPTELAAAAEALSSRHDRLEGGCEDASALLLLCISKYGADPKSGLQLRIPWWEIAGVLGINDHDSNGLQRIEAALRLIQEIRFVVASDENGGILGEGVVVSDWLLEGSNRIPGERGNPHADIDATFTISLSAEAVGTLAAYFNGMEAEASAATKVLEAIASIQDQISQHRSAEMEDLLRRVEGSP